MSFKKTFFLPALFILLAALKSSAVIPWNSDYDEALELARKENKPVCYIAFSAKSRQTPEYFISQRPGVEEQLKRFVPILVKTEYNTPAWWRLWKFLNRSGLNSVRMPTLFVLTPQEEIIVCKDSPGKDMAEILDKAAASYESGEFAKRPKIEWLTSVDKALEESRQQNKPVLLFIYSENCGFCNTLKGTILKKSEIIELSKSFIAVSGDGKKDRNLSNLMWKKLRESGRTDRRAGYPFIALLSPDGTAKECIVGLKEAGDLKEKMEKIKELYPGGTGNREESFKPPFLKGDPR